MHSDHSACNSHRQQNPAALYSLPALIISTGAVIAAFRDCIPLTGAWILLAAFPLAWYILWVMNINRTLISHTVVRGRYVAYCSAIFILCFSIPLFGTFLEWAIRSYFNLPHNIADYTSSWILLNSLSTTALLLMIMFGMALGELYFKWRGELRHERTTARELLQRIDLFKSQLQPEKLLHSLDEVIESCSTDPDVSAARLHTLSKELRTRLYENPAAIEFSPVEVKPISPIENFITLRKYAPWRFLLLQVFVALIALTALFIRPDIPDFSTAGLIAFAGMDIVMNILIFGNVLLTNRFIRHGKIIRYLIRGGIFLLVMAAIIIVVQIFTYDGNIVGTDIPVLYPVLATIASITSIALVLGGVSAFMALKLWLNGRRRMVKLQSETTQIEISLLQNQINPHFLFNVLNNVGVLIYESPREAQKMLSQLKSLLSYQLLDAEREATTLGADADFLINYLSIEKSRKEPFDYTFKMDDKLRPIHIPPLILITFVENASKHSSVVNGHRDVNIEIRVVGNKLHFSCNNTFDPAQQQSKAATGGLGIKNTLRRLALIFGTNFSLQQHVENHTFETSLIIPVKI